MTRRGIDLPEDTWRKLKAHAAVRGQTLSALFGDMASDTLSDRRSVAMREMTPLERSSTGARLEADEEIARLKRELAARPGVPDRGVPGHDRPRDTEPIYRRERQKVIDEALRKVNRTTKEKKP